jgi:hypothetical protein
MATMQATATLKNPRNMTLTPRVLMLCWACSEGAINAAELANAVGLQSQDVFTLIDRVKSEVNDVARSVVAY